MEIEELEMARLAAEIGVEIVISIQFNFTT